MSTHDQTYTNILYRDTVNKKWRGTGMPVFGYDSVNLPSGLYRKVKAVVKSRNELGYRSITEFVAEAVRNRLTEIGETTP